MGQKVKTDNYMNYLKKRKQPQFFFIYKMKQICKLSEMNFHRLKSYTFFFFFSFLYFFVVLGIESYELHSCSDFLLGIQRDKYCEHLPPTL